MHRSLITIDLQAIRHNVRTLRGRLAGAELSDDREGLLERRLEREYRMFLVDAPLSREEVELADPHREHRDLTALRLGRWRPAVELVHHDEQAAGAVGQLERVHVVLGKPKGAHRHTVDLDRVAVRELVDPDPAAVLHELEMRHAAEPGAEVSGDLLRQVDVSDERPLRLAGPGAEVAVAGLPDTTAHRVVRVPMRVEAGCDLADAGPLELELRLLRCVEEDVGPVDEGRGAGADAAAPELARLDADAAAAAGARDRCRAAGTQDLDPHPLIVRLRGQPLPPRPWQPQESLTVSPSGSLQTHCHASGTKALHACAHFADSLESGGKARSAPGGKGIRRRRGGTAPRARAHEQRGPVHGGWVSRLPQLAPLA